MKITLNIGKSLPFLPKQPRRKRNRWLALGIDEPAYEPGHPLQQILRQSPALLHQPLARQLSLGPLLEAHQTIAEAAQVRPLHLEPPRSLRTKADQVTDGPMQGLHQHLQAFAGLIQQSPQLLFLLPPPSLLALLASSLFRRASLNVGPSTSLIR
jgi:hypothetical protein